jgi:DNA-directed RNA polymerase specialized sigma24 family protein
MSDPVLEDVPASEVGQDRVLEARERLASTLAGFSPLDRQIVVMAATGHSLKEIGEATGLSYSNTAVRLHRLRNRLHDKDLEAPKEKL